MCVVCVYVVWYLYANVNALIKLLISVEVVLQCCNCSSEKLSQRKKRKEGDMIHVTDGVYMAGSLLQMKLMDSQGTQGVEERLWGYHTFTL